MGSYEEKDMESFRGGIKLLLGPLSLLMGKELPNLLWLLNPMNTTPLLIKSFFPPKGAKEGGESTSPASAPSTGTTAKPDTKGGKQEKKLAKVGETKDTGDDKAFQKQEQALISANQKNGYEGVMEEIESYAPYEDIKAAPVVLPAQTTAESPKGDQAPSQGITLVGGGAQEDPYEVLDFTG